MNGFPCDTVVSTEIFGISVLVSDHDCDEQPSYEYCGEETKWFEYHYSALALIWFATSDIYNRLLVSGLLHWSICCGI